MMKRIIQICSMLVLSAAFFVVSAQAQTVNRIDAKIPFDFQIGSKTYAAGEYVIKVSRSSADVAGDQLEDKNGKRLDSGLLAENGDSGKSKLVFGRNENNDRVLSKVIVDDKGFSVLKTTLSKGSAKGKASGSL